MKKFKVSLWLTEYANVDIKAENKEEASEKVMAILDEDGLEGLQDHNRGLNYDYSDREYHTEDVEEIID